MLETKKSSADSPALRPDGPVLRQTVWLTLPDNPPMAKGVSLHTKP